MRKQAKGNQWVRKTAIAYFGSTVLVYAVVFLVLMVLISYILTILQMHPYFFLLTAILVLLADIFITNHLINHTWRNQWISKKR